MFANSSVALLADMGFDGIDIDWEYPTNDAEATDMVYLLQAVRSALNAYSRANGLNYHFLLTAASPAGLSNYNMMHLKAMDTYLDHWNLMAYDYAGSFSSATGHQANLYDNSHNAESTPFSTDKAVSDYIAAGVPSSKIVLGMPIYGRTFESTSGLGKAYSGIGSGSWENGIWDYKALPRQGATVTYDALAGASYSYDAKTGELVSFDDEDMVFRKAAYIMQQGLGGGMYWEASADREGSESLMGMVAKKLGSNGGLDASANCLRYPVSRYDNLRKGMPGE